MQWLIDIVYDAMVAAGFLTTSYVHRGDPVAPDFATGDLTLDGVTHELDLSTIVPEGTKAVDLKIQVINGAAGQLFEFFRHGLVNKHVALIQLTQVAMVGIAMCGVVAVDEDRKIDYVFAPGPWVAVLITVNGWWF